MNTVKVFLWCLLLWPTVVHAEWIGTSDKRRYVTDEEKMKFPYNTVVRFDNGSTSTGTFVSKNLILTCRHCVDDSDSIDYYTTDGKKHTGFVFGVSKNADYALVATTDIFDGDVPGMYAKTSYAGSVKRIGYDNLKVLSDDELTVIKKSVANILANPRESDAGLSTADKVMSMMIDLEIDLLLNHNCSDSNSKGCVHCVGDRQCIFWDNHNLKVQDSCTIVSLSDGKLKTTCAGTSGASGSSLLSNSDNNIRGILVSVDPKFEIGIKTQPTSYAVKPEDYYESVNIGIDKVEKIVNQ